MNQIRMVILVAIACVVCLNLAGCGGGPGPQGKGEKDRPARPAIPAIASAAPAFAPGRQFHTAPPPPPETPRRIPKGWRRIRPRNAMPASGARTRRRRALPARFCDLPETEEIFYALPKGHLLALPFLLDVESPNFYLYSFQCN